MGPFVIHILVPLRIQRSPFFTALVFMAAASLPLPGSDKQNAPSQSPLHIFGRYFFFCSSVPSFQMGMAHKIVDAPHANDTPPSWPPNVKPSLMKQVSKQESPVPPYSSGIGAPIKPAAAIFFQIEW